ncbi:MAG: DNA mismatch repair protein MutS, partial [Cyanobacteria bacterium J06635_11]
YHELNELASLLSNVENYQVTVIEMPDQIIFLHQVRPGGADKSYGIEAGRLAGLPPSVISRAKQVMGQIEQHSKIAVGLRENKTDVISKAAAKAETTTKKKKRRKKPNATTPEPKQTTETLSEPMVNFPLEPSPEEQLDMFG